ncbi:MAG TPA: hypothetical protein VKE95_10465 [Burkholderiales bacterium]|nr:hypothetical protein [Burkholderiales bacterium]
MERPLLAWWLLLCTVAVVNPVLWFLSARRLERAEPPASRRWMLWLAAVYVVGCGFRSVFPMIDAARLCLHDNWISRIAVGRTIATIAELAFAMQWALLLGEADTRAARLASRAIVPIIVVAELASWSAVLTTNYMLHAVENSLWTLAAALGLAAFLSLRLRAQGATARFLDVACAGGLVYIAFMVIVDVPMYLARWQAAGGFTVPLDEGVRAVLERCVVRREWSAWREDATWLTLYFTVCVWVSVALPHAPRLGTSRQEAAPPPRSAAPRAPETSSPRALP